MSDSGTPTDPTARLDESRDLDIGPLDWVLGALTLPLLFWALMYAVTGGEGMFATRRGRYRLYAVLLAIEVLVATCLAWWIT